MDIDIAYVWASVIPQHTQTDPSAPTIYPVSTFSKRIDFSCMFSPTDTSLFGDVDSRKGIVVWFVNRGALSAYHCGLVPPGHRKESMSWSNYDPTIQTHELILTQLNLTGLATLVWSETAVPYRVASTFRQTPQTVAASARQITFAPNVELLYSQLRVTSGSLEMRCDTLPIGNIPMVGTFMGGTVTDARTVQQQYHSSERRFFAFDANDIIQNTDDKDAISHVPISVGLIGLVGCDISPGLSAPDICKFRPELGIPIIVTGTGYYGYGDALYRYLYNNNLDNYWPLSGLALTLPANSPRVLYSGWVTAWNSHIDATMATFLTADGNRFGVTPQTVQFDGMLMTDAPDITFTAGLDYIVWKPATVTPPPNAPFELSYSLQYRVQFNHVFVLIGENNRLEYYNFNEIHDVGPSAFDYAPEHIDAYGPIMASVTVSARKFQYGYVSGSLDGNGTAYRGNQPAPMGAMYLGTQVLLVVCVLPVGPPPTANPYYLGKLTFVTLTISSPTLLQDGNVGPCRIFRYDDLDYGQQMSVRGVIHVQGVPLGTIGPFIKTDGADSDGLQDVSLVTRLTRMYHSLTSPLRRMWRTTDYKRFISQGAPSAGMLREWSQLDHKDHAKRTRVGMHAEVHSRDHDRPSDGVYEQMQLLDRLMTRTANYADRKRQFSE